MNLERSYSEIGQMFSRATRRIKNKLQRDSKRKREFLAMERRAREQLQALINRESSGSTSDIGYRIQKQGDEIIKRIKSKYKKGEINSVDVEYALRDLFSEKTTHIDLRTQNITIGDILLSDGSSLSLDQRM